MDNHLQTSEREAQILAVLNRQISLKSLDALIYAYKPEPRPVDLSRVAIVIDSSAFLRLGPQTDVIDYLSSRHAAPIILPGQSVQEFWNNNLNVAESVATGIGRKFDALKAEVEKVDTNFQDFSDRFSVLLAEFRASFGFAFDGATVRRTLSLFDVLKQKAITTYVSRDRFSNLAVHRKKTKTPPGFKDESDGDFFVWLDMLDGLLVAKGRGINFEQVVLVTNDKKLDWSREGVAHPLLSAEIEALVGATFETWDVHQLARRVSDLSG